MMASISALLRSGKLENCFADAAVVGQLQGCQRCSGSSQEAVGGMGLSGPDGRFKFHPLLPQIPRQNSLIMTFQCC